MSGSLLQDEEAVLRARDAAFKGGDLQTELPHTSQPVFDLPDWLVGMGQLFAHTACIVASLCVVLAVGFALRGLLLGFSGRRRLRRTAEKELDLGGTRLDIDLSDVDAHAARGAFAEAIHRLLLATLTELCRLAELDLDPSLTSREIVSTIPMPDPARRALAGLVAAVEVSHFGEADVERADWENCRGRFDVFVESLAGTSP